MYVAFSRPSDAGATHLMTVAQGTAGRQEAVEAANFQPLIFNLQVRDVTVLVAGQTVANDATVQLIMGQQARVRVTPNGGRNYGVALLRPVNGAVLRLDGDNRIIAQAQAGTEAVQVDRLHEPDDLFTHLRRRLSVPVREFSVQVLDTPPLLNALPADVAGVFAGLTQNPRPGDSVFVIVPAPIDVTLQVDAATLGGLTQPSITVVTTPEALTDFVGDGAIFQVTFAAGDTPAAAIDVVVRVTVRGDAPIPMQATIRVEPP
jgi:hypothetical protein